MLLSLSVSGTAWSTRHSRAEMEEWDLIVVGRHPMASLARVITGSIATTVVERAHTTVAVVPDTAPSS